MEYQECYIVQVIDVASIAGNVKRNVVVHLTEVDNACNELRRDYPDHGRYRVVTIKANAYMETKTHSLAEF